MKINKISLSEKEKTIILNMIQGVDNNSVGTNLTKEERDIKDLKGRLINKSFNELKNLFDYIEAINK